MMPISQPCASVFSQVRAKLDGLASEALAQGYSPTDFVVLALDVTDPRMFAILADVVTDVVEAGQSGGQPNDRAVNPGARRVACRAVGPDTAISIAECSPAAVAQLRQPPPEGRFYALVIVGNDLTLYALPLPSPAVSFEC
ncbi:MAG: hypothetical protein PHT12_01665 [Patescibacteria group bacterium]|nr:hypothetical protein [Patescibacteria group bacterium]